jgi:hypothetical protein
VAGESANWQADGLLQLRQLLDRSSGRAFCFAKALEWVFCWLAVSGAACLLERWGHEPVLIQSISEPAEGDINHVLRSEAFGTAEQSGVQDGSHRPTTRIQP